MDEKKMFSTRIDRALHKALKMLAVENEKSISIIAEEAFRDLLNKYEKKIRKSK